MSAAEVMRRSSRPRGIDTKPFATVVTTRRRRPSAWLAVSLVVISLMTFLTPGRALAEDQPFNVWNIASGQCLDSNSNGAVYTLKCNDGNYQRWKFVWVWTYGYVLQNVATNRCLDSNAQGQVYTLACSPTGANNYQIWLDITQRDQSKRELRNYQTVRNLESNSSGNIWTDKVRGDAPQLWGKGAIF